MIESFQRIIDCAKEEDKDLMLESFSLLCEATSLSSTCKQWFWFISFFNSSAIEASDKHPEWKSSIRIELLCCYLSNPLFVDQSADLFDECITGTSSYHSDYQNIHKESVLLMMIHSPMYSILRSFILVTLKSVTTLCWLLYKWELSSMRNCYLSFVRWSVVVQTDYSITTNRRFTSMWSVHIMGLLSMETERYCMTYAGYEL